ncbi:MAG: hypothetical protein LPJ89_09175 [Hymenobacteraceae bacterium]|nr:hypothetical protein [Hymenobacteraceae bacterium]MDX5396359.1 hypothetical protein [Hymenobacteraceae bacterium]MDX5443936.1 hypothetical protein [Hymenobacteraceae bacterium]MDX5512421.1 hypothetical protein [Hymenobacteraceae bacterium]
MQIFSQIRNLLVTLERKVNEKEVITDEQVKEVLTAEIAKAYLYKTKIQKKNADEADINFALLSAEQIDAYLESLKKLEEKINEPSTITAQCKPVEEREINRKLLLILNRLQKRRS